MRNHHANALLVVAIATAFAATGACANDPEYLPGAMSIQGGTMTDAMGNLVAAKGSLALPIKPESQKDMDARAALQATLPADVVVPYVKVGDVDISVEWTVTNLDMANPGTFLVELNGANEAFTYYPSVIMLGMGEDAPPTPGLSGDIPTQIPANGSLQGLFREDQVVEAAIDLDQITRGNMNPLAATLTVSKNIDSFQPTMTPAATPTDPNPTPVPVGDAIPRAEFRGLIRVDLVFKPDRPMQLDYNVRVRDHRGIIDDKGVGSPTTELWDMVVTCADLANACPPVYMPAAAGP